MVRERWGSDTSKKNACYGEFLDADWKTMLKDMSDTELEQELTRMMGVPE